LASATGEYYQLSSFAGIFRSHRYLQDGNFVYNPLNSEIKNRTRGWGLNFLHFQDSFLFHILYNKKPDYYYGSIDSLDFESESIIRFSGLYNSENFIFGAANSFNFYPSQLFLVNDSILYPVDGNLDPIRTDAYAFHTFAEHLFLTSGYGAFTSNLYNSAVYNLYILPYQKNPIFSDKHIRFQIGMAGRISFSKSLNSPSSLSAESNYFKKIEFQKLSNNEKLLPNVLAFFTTRHLELEWESAALNKNHADYLLSHRFAFRKRYYENDNNLDFGFTGRIAELATMSSSELYSGINKRSQIRHNKPFYLKSRYAFGYLKWNSNFYFTDFSFFQKKIPNFTNNGTSRQSFLIYKPGFKYSWFEMSLYSDYREKRETFFNIWQRSFSLGSNWKISLIRIINKYSFLDHRLDLKYLKIELSIHPIWQRRNYTMDYESGKVQSISEKRTSYHFGGYFFKNGLLFQIKRFRFNYFLMFMSGKLYAARLIPDRLQTFPKNHPSVIDPQKWHQFIDICDENSLIFPGETSHLLKISRNFGNSLNVSLIGEIIFGQKEENPSPNIHIYKILVEYQF
jgi:hypothetical protein